MPNGLTRSWRQGPGFHRSGRLRRSPPCSGNGRRQFAANFDYWLVEGIAEYTSMLGRPVSQYSRLDLVRYANKHGRAGLTAAEAKSVTYGESFLTVRRLADVYGEEATLTFFDRCVHGRWGPEEASALAFGKPWNTVSADIDRYIRNV
jgi:hypothetical protein